jgi:hypothetical protein
MLESPFKYRTDRRSTFVSTNLSHLCHLPFIAGKSPIRPPSRSLPMPTHTFQLAEPAHDWTRRESEASDAQETKVIAVASRLAAVIKEHVDDAETVLSAPSTKRNLAEFISKWKKTFEAELRPGDRDKDDE